MNISSGWNIKNHTVCFVCQFFISFISMLKLGLESFVLLWLPVVCAVFTVLYLYSLIFLLTVFLLLIYLICSLFIVNLSCTSLRIFIRYSVSYGQGLPICCSAGQAVNYLRFLLCRRLYSRLRFLNCVFRLFVLFGRGQLVFAFRFFCLLKYLTNKLRYDGIVHSA